ncbi:MAG TPA: T9SS type A sorting domain-containing protein, partial [Acinetobacter sp.]|nr:T9SS type A sorting domain-containing protein [Acinetobacter sp.]
FTDTIQSRTVALLDLGPENQETNGSNLFSAAHMLDVAGVSYKIVTDIYEAQNYKMVVGSSTVGNGVFSSNDHIALRNYVRNGGVLFFIRLKDPDLYPLFGVSGFDSKTTRHIMSWNMATNDDVLEWFDDPREQSISLGDTAQPNVIETLGYTTNTATSLGQYDDGKASVTKNPYGNGFAYNFGISLKEIIFRNQVNKDYDAEREYTNAFEPTTDDLFLLTRAMYTKHVSKGVWKHTSPGNSQSTLIITHDIDALSSVNLMTAFANYEDSAQMGATYFMTAHYNDDIISAFYDSSIYDLNQIILKNRVIASHSVGHFVDMDDTTVVLSGQPGNTRSNYQPVNNGGSTQGATIWGELEVSKNILQSDCNTTVRSFRPGYLLVHPKQMQVMDSLGYDFSSSYTAPDLLTNFPFFIHEDKSFQSRLTNMLEIPIATSDVIRDYVLDSTNFPTLVTKWKNVYMSNHMNHAPTVLLIHPTRNYKLSAQRSLVNQLPNGVTIKSLEDYGDFWRNRNLVNFTSKLTGTSLLITISNSSFPLDSGFSLIVDDAQHLSQIAVKDESNNAIAFVEEIWGAHDKILYLKAENVIGLQEIFAGNNKRNGAVSLLVQPNPAVAEAVVDFTLDKALDVTIEVFSSNGVKISDLVKEPFLAGKHSRKLDCSKFAPGMYFLKLTTSAGIAVTKLMVQPK